MPYALLQLSLDQTIDRNAMEEASVAAPSVARADCARLHRELFGIVAENLDHANATAFQKALRQHGFDTELIDQSLLPQLPPSQSAPRFRIDPDALVVTDLYGRDTRYGWSTFVFAAGGFLTRERARAERSDEWTIRPGPHGSVSRKVESVTTYPIRKEREFRLEFFFCGAPYRYQWILGERSTINCGGKLLRLRQQAELVDLMREVGFLPSDRLNLGIRKACRGEVFEYPSVRGFEEEVVWSFYRLTRLPE